jgi:hypothetical protein
MDQTSGLRHSSDLSQELVRKVCLALCWARTQTNSKMLENKIKTLFSPRSDCSETGIV